MNFLSTTNKYKVLNLVNSSRQLINASINRSIQTSAQHFFLLKPVCNQDELKNRSAEFAFGHIPKSRLEKYLNEEQKHNGKLIYAGSLTNQLKRAKILSLSSSLLGIMLLPFMSNTLSASGLFAKLFVFGTTGFFIFVTPLFSQFLSKRYVIRMYYNYEEKKFTAILFSFFMYEYKLEFKLDDVYVPDVPGPFSTIKLKKSNRSLFVDLFQFEDVGLAEKIYGYDKPMDYKKYEQKD